MSKNAIRFIKKCTVNKKRGIRYTCPHCRVGFRIRKPLYIGKNKDITGTADCSNCNALLFIKNNRAYLFHEYMHKLDNRWPKDGNNTAYINV